MADLKTLSDAATQGELWFDRESQNLVAKQEGVGPIYPINWKIAHRVFPPDADLIVALVNKFRAGELVEREKAALDVLAAQGQAADALDEVDRLRAAEGRLRLACVKTNDDICQTIGKALGYPWFKDDHKNFPFADEANGVCVGDHVAESIAAEAADEIARLRAENERLKGALTPSGETKAAYIGDFSIPLPIINEDGDEEVLRPNVPWTTIKEIMKAIMKYAEGKDG